MIKNTIFLALAMLLPATGVSAADKPASARTATTLENLQTAFHGESSAKVRYEAFAVKADEEGYAGVASLFRAAALSEGIHAAKHAKAIEALGFAPEAAVKTPVVKSTKMNLIVALSGENKESKKMYPAFAKQALADKSERAAMSFKGAMAAEISHAKLFSQALANLGDWKAKRKFLVCQTCGYATSALEIKVCPVCYQPRSQFTEVE